MNIIERSIPRRLTDEQSDLVAANVGLAYRVASDRVRGIKSLNREEVISAACLGLCHAGQRFDPARGAFTTLAYKCMHNQITHEDKRLTRKNELRREVKCGTEWIARLVANPADRLDLKAWMKTLSTVNREIVEMRLRGLNPSEIAQAMGVKRHSVYERMIRMIQKRRREVGTA